MGHNPQASMVTVSCAQTPRHLQEQAHNREGFTAKVSLPTEKHCDQGNVFVSSGCSLWLRWGTAAHRTARLAPLTSPSRARLALIRPNRAVRYRRSTLLLP